jgi:branched-chain amino acid transport system permease protein
VIAFLFVSQVTQVGGFSPIAGIDRYTPGFMGDVVNDRQRLYYVSLLVAVVVYVLIRYLVRTPFGIALEGIRDEPTRMASLGFNVTLHRTVAFAIGSLIAGLSGVLFAWWSGQLSPSDIGLQATIQLLVIAVIGGLTRIEGAWLGAFAYIWISNEVTNRIPEDGLWVVGGTFNTVIGLAFLAIVIASPDGLMGLWDRIWNGLRTRGGPGEPAVATGSAGSQA